MTSERPQQQVSRLFLIRSEDRQSNESSDNFSAFINYDFNRTSNVFVAVNSVALPISWYGINQFNNRLTLYEKRIGFVFVTHDLTIPEGNYTSTSIVSALQSALNFASGTNLVNPIAYIVSFSVITGKITINSNGGDFVLTGTVSNSGYRMIGIDKFADTGLPSSMNYNDVFISPRFVDLTFVKQINLKSSIAGNGFTTAPNSSNTLMASIPLEASSPFELISWKNQNPRDSAYQIRADDFQGLQNFYLEGGNGERLEMFSDWVLELIMYYQ